MDKRALLSLYVQDRRSIVLPGMGREETPQVVRHLSPNGDVLILWSALSADNADDIIRGQIADCEKKGSALCWVVYANDSPSNLKERLLAHGFDADEPETTMALDIDAASASLLGPIEHDVRRITGFTGAYDAVAIRQQIWPGGDAAAKARGLLERLREQPETLALFVAYVDGVPAGTAQISFYRSGRFASLVRAATLPEYRGRGLYTALVTARVQEARRRGIHYLDTDASPMSRPILEKLGFRCLTESTSCDYSTTG
jgi:GNAT superfamily N-acetyltransferase